MPAVNDILAGVANVAARSLIQRQDDASTTAMATSLDVGSLTTVSATASVATSTVQDNHPTSAADNPRQQTQPTSSPLLFFVALGFGVVFTNLWIIVGVKYCFRYNARNRALRMAEDGEPINMENMPRPHRRRREKKLMTMDEVNEKFPMQKYKNWVASRAQEGLPTAGGVSAPASRANSVRDVEGVVPEVSKERDSADDRPTTSATARANTSEKRETADKDKDKGEGTASGTAAAAEGQASTAANRNSESEPHKDDDDDDDDEDERINAALPPECLGTSGDTCAICIDTLEDDEDVRGLPCGHAFHAQCLDPWLTTRRACCPLCKADYYTPKPRRTQTNTDAQLPAPPADAPADANANNQQSGTRIESRARMNLPQPPQSVWQNIMARGRGVLPGVRSESEQPSRPNRWRRANAEGANRAGTSTSQTAPVSPTNSTGSQAQTPGRWQRFRQAFPHFQMQNRNNPALLTPGQLESGVRS